MSEEEKPKGKKSSGLKIFAIALIIVVVAVLLFQGKLHVNQPPGNYAPEVMYHYDTHLNSLQGNITLVAGIEDKDGDKMNVQFWVKENASANWTGIGNFEGYNGEYQVETDYAFKTASIHTAYWKVEVTDYEDYTIGGYEFKFTGKRN